MSDNDIWTSRLAMREFSFLFWLGSHAALAYVVSIKSLMLTGEKAQVFLYFLELLSEDILSSYVKKNYFLKFMNPNTKPII